MKISSRGLGFRYDTSRQLAVNSVTPVRVYLPSDAGKVTRQVFSVDIQRDGAYLIAAWNKGRDKADLEIAVYKEYEEKFEHTFIIEGFKGRKVEPDLVTTAAEVAADALSTNLVYSLPRDTYYVVVTAVVPSSPSPPVPPTKKIGPLPTSAIDAVYEIGIATNPMDFRIPDIPIASGIITNPQVPAESAVYLAKHRYAPVNLEDGVTQTRLTRMKGSHELFGILVPTSGWFADITFEVGLVFFLLLCRFTDSRQSSSRAWMLWSSFTVHLTRTMTVSHNLTTTACPFPATMLLASVRSFRSRQAKAAASVLDLVSPA